MSCNAYIVNYDNNNEPILGKNMQYSIIEKPSESNIKKIDTSVYYVQIFEGRYYNEDEMNNPMVLKFHNDGYFKHSSVKYYNRFSYRTKNTIWYGGKYWIYENKIELESFAPSKGGKTKVYGKLFETGRFENDKIIFDDKNNKTLISVYKKNKNLIKLLKLNL
jgi:hypothetical protein